MPTTSPPRRTRAARRTLHIWTPEDKAFWEQEGQAIARINLWISVPALFLAFAIWQVWSVVAVNLPALGFRYTTDQLFWLAAAPALSGATLRIFYSFMVPLVGGRRWTAISTASLLIPAIGIGIAVQDNTTPYPTMLVLALLCGFGGGNFSSSMANISFFFPKERKAVLREPARDIGRAHRERAAGQADEQADHEEMPVGGGVGHQPDRGDGRRHHQCHHHAPAVAVGPDAQRHPHQRAGQHRRGREQAELGGVQPQLLAQRDADDAGQAIGGGHI